MIVCKCNNCTIQDVKNFYKAYPNMPKAQMKCALNIGTVCGTCCTDDSPFKNFYDLYNELSTNNL